MQEFICRDGRMSVNGICAIDQQNNEDTTDITKTIIEASKLKDKKTLDNLAEEGSTDYFPDLGEEKDKGKFEWEMDKPSKVKDFKNTISENINAYNSFIEENLGIPSGAQNAIRAATSIGALATGGSLAAIAGPFALPFLIGGGLRKKEEKRIEKLTDQDRQGENIAPIDMMTYDIPTYGEPGFNIHNDAKDKADNTPSGPQNQMESDYGYGSDAGFY
tara:strand:- start:125 stop:778 length:654 start_codon:yes stop_codon:yes gene_type:complete